MASWMIHFRVAQAWLNHPRAFAHSRLAFPRTHETDVAFVMGNIAPDSGLPTGDGIRYEPDKQISHFHIPSSKGYHACDTVDFTRRYLIPSPEDPTARAFYAGYLCHLHTDNRWMESVSLPARARFAEEWAIGNAAFLRRVKPDWYDRDFLYLKQHPDLPTFRLYAESPPFPNTYVDFFSEHALDARRTFILSFYKQGVETVVERETYISEAELTAFVTETAESFVP